MANRRAVTRRPPTSACPFPSLHVFLTKNRHLARKSPRSRGVRPEIPQRGWVAETFNTPINTGNNGDPNTRLFAQRCVWIRSLCGSSPLTWAAYTPCTTQALVSIIRSLCGPDPLHVLHTLLVQLKHLLASGALTTFEHHSSSLQTCLTISVLQTAYPSLLPLTAIFGIRPEYVNRDIQHGHFESLGSSKQPTEMLQSVNRLRNHKDSTANMQDQDGLTCSLNHPFVVTSG